MWYCCYCYSQRAGVVAVAVAVAGLMWMPLRLSLQFADIADDFPGSLLELKPFSPRLGRSVKRGCLRVMSFPGPSGSVCFSAYKYGEGRCNTSDMIWRERYEEGPL